MDRPQSPVLEAWIEGIGALGPGIASWPQLRAVLRGDENYLSARTVVPAPQLLPPAERRRAVRMVKLTLAAALEAVAQAQRDASALPSIFSSSSGDSDNMHAICETLASSERDISPTRFHNSVHNAAAGYWSIASGATPASTALCAFDASFGAALIEAMAWLATEKTPILLVAYDLDYPEPLRALRPLPDAFCVALALSPASTAQAFARIRLRIGDAPADALAQPALETLRRSIPAARCLPLLDLLARKRAGSVALEYLDRNTLLVEVQA